MKKFIYIISIFISFIFLYNPSFASCNWTCKIKDWPAPVLEEYFKNIRKVVSNITNEVSKEKVDSSREMKVVRKEMLKVYNSVFRWPSYNSSVNFLQYNLTWEIPVEVKRDLDMIEKENKSLYKFSENLAYTWKWNISIKNACDWVENCNLNWEANEIMSALMNSNEALLNYYKLSLLDKWSDFNWTFVLVPSNFKGDFWNYYNKYTITDCSACESWVKDRINKEITKISSSNQKSKDWLKKWTDAWNLLIWKKWYEAESQEIERRALEKELNSKWISANNSQATLNNLSKYNKTWYSDSNNPISNSFESVKNSLNVFPNSFDESIKELLNKWDKSIPISQITLSKKEISNWNKTASEIDELYSTELPLIAKDDLNSEKLQWRIIQMHIDITNAINILDKTISVSQKVCNDQDRWNWKCEY